MKQLYILFIIFGYSSGIIRPTDMCLDGKTICPINYGYYCDIIIDNGGPFLEFICCKPIGNCRSVFNMESNRIINPGN